MSKITSYKGFKVGDTVVVKGVAKISKGRYKMGDIGIIDNIDRSAAPFNIRFTDYIHSTSALYFEEIELYTPKNKDNWVPFKGGKCPVDEDTLVLVQWEDGKTSSGKSIEFTMHKGKTNLWPDSIVAYKVITPYTPPREKIIFKNKKEMLTELISRGKLYLNEEGNENVYFSEDDRYTLGYVQEDGRSELADKILDCLEFWVE